MSSFPCAVNTPGVPPRTVGASRRVLVIGADGASPEMIYAWANGGLLPAFRALMERGVRGRLTSTVPPHSGPAWISAITGKNPGKHGVFYFTTVNPRRAPPRIVSSHDIRTETMFDVAGRNGKRSVVVNVPITYPPWRIKGVMVSGIFAPSEKVVFTSPPEVGPGLVANGYEVEFSTWDTWKENRRLVSRDETPEELSRMRNDYFNGTLEMDDKIADAFIGLLQNEDWDLSMVMLPGLDRVQHLLWQPMVRGEDLSAGRQFGCSRFVVEAYQNVDRLVKKILGTVDGDTWIVFLSDHGFGLTPRIFYANRWLRSQGLLTPSRRASIYGRGIAKLKGLAQEIGDRPADKSVPAFHILLPLSSIDMPQTKAYSPTPYGLVNVNGKSTEEREILANSLAKQFEEIVDPKSGRRVILKAHLSSEIYPGPCQAEASDLILEPVPDYHIENRMDGTDAFADAERHPALHKPEGILLLSGPQSWNNFELSSAHIYDVAPTILTILGVPLPKDIDGKTLSTAFRPDGPVAMEEADQIDDRGGTKEVSDRVRRLKAEGKI